MALERSKHMETRTAPLRLLRAKEVAEMLGCSPSRVRELVREGQLRSIRLGEEGWHRFDPREVERLLENLP
jgi:excisionase family DNA binding protein